MKRKYSVFLLAGLLLSMAACAVYEPGPAVVRDYQTYPTYQTHPDFQARIDNQQSRIDRGIATGQLTRPEAYTLQDNLNWIRTRYGRLRADGLLTPREVGKLEQMLDRNSRMIENKRRNPVRRIY